jgi:hypothetical protein
MPEPIEPSVRLNPTQLLGVILKSVLEDRITDEEIGRICSVYRETVIDYFNVSPPLIRSRCY